MAEKYYEVEGAVFRKQEGTPMEVFGGRTGDWFPYEGDTHRIYMNSHPMTLEEVKPYMDAPEERPAGGESDAKA